MSSHVLHYVWRHDRHEHASLLVLLYMADIADDYGLCWPTYDDLAENARLSAGHVKAVAAKLELDRSIRIYRRPGKHNFFRILAAGGRCWDFKNEHEVPDNLAVDGSEIQTPGVRNSD